MKSSILFLLAVLIAFCAHSQKRVNVFFADHRPFNYQQGDLIKANTIKKEMIYKYKQRGSNKDSLLLVVNYFDSAGNLIEKDEFNSDDNNLRQVSNFTYVSGHLMKVEKQAFISENNVSVITYEYDNAGDRANEKNYNLDENKSYILRDQNRWEYDSIHRLCKNYTTLVSGQSYLYKTYHYAGDQLEEIKVYEQNGKWFYSYLYYYDSTFRKKSEYLFNGTESKLQNEYFYSVSGKLIRQVSYGLSSFHVYLDHSTQQFEFLKSDLVFLEKLNASNGDVFYFKHYYFDEY